MNKRKPYTTLFYKTIQDGSVGSAKEIIPIVIDALNPKSVIDFGCGVGAWLSVFIEHGINNILGIDDLAAETPILKMAIPHVVVI
jgi:ribosomal protein L11 methylase PrmA